MAATPEVEYGNPLLRYQLIHGADANQLAALHAAFLAGDWSAFEPWLHALRKRLLPPPTTSSAVSAPHASFFLELLKTPASAGWLQQLEELLHARRYVAGLPDPLGSLPPPPLSTATRSLLCRYLAVFQQPACCASPMTAA